MKAAQKKFILERLIPYILREKGRGFVMEEWISQEAPPLRAWWRDGEGHYALSCGTVSCIGGSVQILRGFKGCQSFRRIAAALGLSEKEAEGLCYCWKENSLYSPYCWPLKFASAFRRARTTLEKSRIAARLLRAVVKTEGKILHNVPPPLRTPSQPRR